MPVHKNTEISNVAQKSDRQETNPIAEYFYSGHHKLIHKWFHYFDIYHSHFKRFIGTECTILEIGVDYGGSLQMWKNYFGVKAKIYGIDINPQCKALEEENVEVFIGSQSDREFLREVKSRMSKIDILIDDGGHTMEQQIISFEELFEHINDNGIYLCEDTHTSYWEEYSGGYQKPGSFIEFSKTLIDHLNAWHIRNGGLQPSTLTRNIGSLHYYDSIFVIEKKKRVPPWHERRGSDGNNLLNIIGPRHLDIFQLKLSLLGITTPKSTDFKPVSLDPSTIESLFPELFNGMVWPQTGETMIGYKRLANVEFCVTETVQNKIEGDLIETGVWRGGACIFMRALLSSLGDFEKRVWVADSFEGLPKPNPADYPADEGNDLFKFTELAVTQDEVTNNFSKYHFLDDQVAFLKGWFKDTLPTAPIEKLSVLRLDGDMYESTIDVLFYLYPKLSIGGYCIIDDWGAVPGCKKAVEDYRQVFNIKEDIVVIDWTGVFWKKEIDVFPLSRDQFIAEIKNINC
jgi:hypothetical protein